MKRKPRKPPTPPTATSPQPDPRILNEAIANLGEGVLITGDNLDWPGPKILFANQAMSRITGYAPDELVGQTPRILQGPKTDRATLDQIRAAASANRPCNAELINYRKDGIPYHAEIFITPLINTKGQRTHFVSIHRDITGRKKTENKLRRMSRVFQKSADPIIITDPAGRITEVNDEAVRSYGWSRKELIGQSIKKLVPPERHHYTDQLLQRCRHQEEARNIEVLRITKDGKVHPALNTLTLLSDPDGTPIGIASIAKDLTVLKQAEQAVREREEQLRSILNAAVDAIITIDQKGTVIGCNAATEEMFGYTREQIIGQNVSMLMPEPHRNHHNEYLERFAATGQHHIFHGGREFLGLRSDGTAFPILLTVNQVERLGLFTGIVHDISDRQKLQQQIVQAAEEEQQRIAQDLHDGLGSHLHGVTLLCQSLVRSLQRHGLPEAAEAARLSRLLQEAIEQCRRVARGLHPVEGSRNGLLRALRDLATEKRDLKIQCRVHCPAPVHIPSTHVANHLFRIAQEAVNNAVRHGNASRVTIRLAQTSDAIQLRIRDNGSGMPSRIPPENHGLGLKTMAYRARLLNGFLQIHPAPKGGLEVLCRIPLPPQPPPKP